MKGHISQWKDDKGFGFITSDDNQKVFFHVSSLTTKTRRPKVGDVVVFVETIDSQNRLKATSVAIEGLSKTSQNKSNNKVDPITKTPFDYMLFLLLIISVSFTAYTYLKSNKIEDALVFSIPTIIALFLLSRQKKPKSSSFSCAKCNKRERYDTRTISAWNSGLTRLYCKSCHVEWLRSRPKQIDNYSSNKSQGCLGIITLLVSSSLFGGYSIMQWLLEIVI